MRLYQSLVHRPRMLIGVILDVLKVIHNVKNFLFKTKNMEKIEEIWKDIPGYENYYQVSNLGRIRSLDRFYNGRTLKGKILKLSPNLYGYLRFTAKKDNITKTLHVHRIVLLTFNPISENK